MAHGSPQAAIPTSGVCSGPPKGKTYRDVVANWPRRYWHGSIAVSVAYDTALRCLGGYFTRGIDTRQRQSIWSKRAVTKEHPFGFALHGGVPPQRNIAQGAFIAALLGLRDAANFTAETIERVGAWLPKEPHGPRHRRAAVPAARPDNYMGARCLDPPHDGRTYCELSLLHTDLCSSAESFVACAARVGWAEVAGTLSAKCVLSPFFAIVAPPEVVPRHTTAADPRPTHVQDRPRGNVSAGPVPNSWRQWPAPKPGGSSGPSGPGVEPLFSDGPFPYVPPEDRPPSPFPPPRVLPEYTGHDCPVHRMTMAIPEELIAPRVARHKLFGFAPHVPHRYPRTSNRDGFVYPFGRHDEALAYELYRRSHFAFTHRRGCWTAQRHYDILATGCVPVFLDLRLCRDLAECLPGFPAELLQEALALPGVSYLSTHAHLRSTFVDDPIPYHNHWVMNIKGPAVIADGFDRRRYDDLAARMLAWTRANLTTRVMASNFLRRLGPEAERAARVLVVSNWYLPETGSLLHGLVSLGINVTHRQDDDTALYAGFPHAATELEMAAHRNTVVKRDRRSNGFTYAFRVNRHHFAPASTAAVERGLQERRYDVVVFSVMGWQRPDHALFKRAVAAGYGNTTLAVVDGTDQVRMLRKSASIPVHCHAATLFSREMMPHGREPRPAM